MLTLNLGGGCARKRGAGGPLPLQPVSFIALPGATAVAVLVSFSGVAHGAMPVTVRGYEEPVRRQTGNTARSVTTTRMKEFEG